MHLQIIFGNSLRPSILINKIKKLYPNLKEQSDVIEKKYSIEEGQYINKKIAYEELLEKIAILKKEGSIQDIWTELYSYFNSKDLIKDELTKDLEGLEYIYNSEKISKENINKLYGNNLSTSVSRLEKYSACPFSYFLNYGLNLKEKEELKVKSLDTGSFMHNIIDGFFKEVKKEDLSLSEIEEELVEKLVNKLIEEELGKSISYSFVATTRYNILVKRLKNTVLKALKYIIISITNSEFNVKETELNFGRKENNPIIIELENGRQVEIKGAIDRVDIAKDKQDEDKKYIRIIDYKSSNKQMDFSSIYAGIQLQLITYMNALTLDKEIIPAGVLYFSLIEQMIKANNKITDEEIEKEIQKKYKMKGIILADVDVIRMQDTTLKSGTSNIIQAGITTKGELSKSTLKTSVDLDDFKVIQDFVIKTIKEISNEILSGNIDIKPYNKNKKTPCEYCEYKAICGFNPLEENSKYRFIPNSSKDEIIELMKLKNKM